MSKKWKLVAGAMSAVFACCFLFNSLSGADDLARAGYDFQASFSGTGKSVNGAMNIVTAKMEAYANGLNPPPTLIEPVGKPEVRIKMKNFKFYYHVRARVRFAHVP